MTNTADADKFKIEGYDESESFVGWGGKYPLDSVFIRSEVRTVKDAVSRINKGRYELTPDFERDFLWEPDRQSRLIESCLMRIPLPVFYVAEAADGRIIVVDGLQRLTTFKRYLNNKFALQGLGKEKDDEKKSLYSLNGKYFKDLPLKLQERLEDTNLTLYILDHKAPERAKLDIFERVNSGIQLTRQQMRNSLYNGPATWWLKEAANSKLFLKTTDHALDSKSMRDREAINRFCAFKLSGWSNYKGIMDDFLSETLIKMNQMTEDELDKLRMSFDQSMELNFLLFEKHAFRKSLRENKHSASRTPFNISLFDVCSVLFSNVEKSEIKLNKKTIKNRFQALLNDEDFERSITAATHSIKQVKNRFELAENAIQETLT